MHPFVNPGPRRVLFRFPALLLLALLLPGAALAWPVDLAVTLEPGRERFHRLAAVDWVEVQDADIASAELLPGTNELLLTGKRPGRTLLLLYAEGNFAVWRLEVRSAGERAAAQPVGAGELAAARAACPGLEAQPAGALRASVKDAGCRTALLALLRTDAFLARELELTLDVSVLQAQLAALTPALAGRGLRASYRGAGVVLEGSASEAAHRSALWTLFEGSLGRVALEDRVTRAAPDAGTPEVGMPDAGEPLIEVLPPGTRELPRAPAKRTPGSPPSPPRG